MAAEELITVTAVQSKASAVMFGGASISLLSFFGGRELSINEWAVLIGAVTGAIVGVGGFLVNWFYQHKRYKLLEKKVENRIKYPRDTTPSDLGEDEDLSVSS